MQSNENVQCMKPFGMDLPEGRTSLKDAWGAWPAMVRSLLGLKHLDKIHGRVMRMQDVDAPISWKILRALDVSYEMSDVDPNRIPAKGPLVVLGNHPFGALEGIILDKLVRSVRQDVKIMANYLLGRIPVEAFHELFIYVDPFHRADSETRNVVPLRMAMKWLKKGHVLGVFPAGEVSHFQPRNRGISDPPWSSTVGRLIQATQATVLPVYFHGRNSLLFQSMGLIHPRLRTLMLFRELIGKKGSVVRVIPGKAIPYEKLRHISDSEDLTEYLRMKTYLLANRAPRRKLSESRWFSNSQQVPAIQGTELCRNRAVSSTVKTEVAALPAEQCLLDTPHFLVYRVKKHQAPNLLHEIGKLREITFRRAGEGTGKDLDLDRFDEHYHHLFLWSKDNEQVAGGYRLGLTDEILKTQGIDGLYTNTLFEYHSGFFMKIPPAIELGRSFVTEDYQKSYQPLMLLWKGIGEFICARPRYRVFFGPVSIHRAYHCVSRQMIVSFSMLNNFRKDLAEYVKPRTPPKASPRTAKQLATACRFLHDVQDLSELVSDIEKDEKGIPILLKHYMKLGGEVLGFNIDHQFGGVLDALILVDLTRTDRKTLDRYMSREKAGRYLEYHQNPGVYAISCA